MRIVQLSDMHLSADETVYRYEVSPWERLRLVLEALAHETQKPELIVISGDVAHDHAEETYVKVRALFEPLGTEYRVLPGNHDSPELIRKVFGPGNGRFVWEREQWLLAGVSSHLPGQIGGALEEQERSWLLSELHESKCDNKLLFLHHPPVSVGNIFFDAVGLKDGSDLCSELEAVDGLKVVSFGHIHRPFSFETERVKYIAAPSTVHGYIGDEALEVAPDLFGYRVFDLKPNHVETEVRLLNSNVFEDG